MTGILLKYLNEAVMLGIEMAPYLMLGFLFAGILHVYFPHDKVLKYLGKNDLRSVVNSAILGVPLPLCSCGVIPTGISFYKSGASRGSTVSFLISTPQTGVDSIMATGSLLGWPFAIVRPIVAFVTGIFGGVITNRAYRNEPVAGEESGKDPKETIKEGKRYNRLFEMFRYAYFDFLQDIAKWLLIGILLAALIAVLVPDDFFVRYIGNDFLSMLVVLAVAVPLYVCATGSVPIAAVLIMKGVSPGAALVFLMAGPATNVATMTVIGKVMGKKTLALYLTAIIGGALLSGLFINWFLPREWFTLPMGSMHAGHHHEWLPLWLKAGSGVILLILSIVALIRRYWSKKIFVQENKLQTQDIMKEIRVKVMGMTCNHCKMNVENKLNAIQGVEEATVDLATGTVLIKGEHIDLKEVETDVEGIGYKYGGIA